MRIILVFITMLLAGFSGLEAQSQSQGSRAPFNDKLGGIDSLNVFHYSINLEIEYISKHSIKGYTQLSLHSLYNGMNSISLDLQHLVVDSVFVDQNRINQWNYNDTLLQIPLSSNMGITDTLICTVYYHGHPQIDPSGWGGFYFSGDTSYAFNMGVGMQDNPHNYGRVWYPCVDNFTNRATYDFTITVKDSNMAICNGTLISTTQSNGEIQYHWDLHNKIPSYLASVAIGPYVALRDTFSSLLGPVPIAIYVPQYKFADAQASFIHLKQILSAFEYYYGPYRWERVGYVGVPFNSGAMEHATSIHLGLGYIDGATTYETLFAHELSHHWFGDLVCCHSASDMWLNEGWAVFSESLYQEYVYDKTHYKNSMRNKLFDVLKNTHHIDNAYRAVAGVPHNYTYGSTVYDKGATVAQSIRAYLGDSLFFKTIKAYLNLNAYGNQSSVQFRDFIRGFSGIDMTDFFQAWVFSPGFSQFALDSFSIVPDNGNYSINVALRQALNHKPFYANSNRIPITFMDSQWHRKDTIVQFSGQYGNESFTLGFKPKAVFIDLEEQLADATTDYSVVIKHSGNIDFPKAFFKLDVNQSFDSSLFQITYNWVAPDTLGISYPGLHISSKHYWTVTSNADSSYIASGSFKYWRTNDFDADIIKSSRDSLVLLYRKHGGLPWRKLAFRQQGNWIMGYLIVDHLKSGEYVLASYDAQHLMIHSINQNHKTALVISPNPGRESFRFSINKNVEAYALIFNMQAEQVDSILMIPNGANTVGKWKAGDYPAGSYFVVIMDKQGRQLATNKFVISK